MKGLNKHPKVPTTSATPSKTLTCVMFIFIPLIAFYLGTAITTKKLENTSHSKGTLTKVENSTTLDKNVFIPISNYEEISFKEYIAIEPSVKSELLRESSYFLTLSSLVSSSSKLECLDDYELNTSPPIFNKKDFSKPLEYKNTKGKILTDASLIEVVNVLNSKFYYSRYSDILNPLNEPSLSYVKSIKSCRYQLPDTDSLKDFTLAQVKDVCGGCGFSTYVYFQFQEPVIVRGKTAYSSCKLSFVSLQKDLYFECSGGEFGRGATSIVKLNTETLEKENLLFCYDNLEGSIVCE
jgi:hypothetical protein